MTQKSCLVDWFSSAHIGRKRTEDLARHIMCLADSRYDQVILRIAQDYLNAMGKGDKLPMSKTGKRYLGIDSALKSGNPYGLPDHLLAVYRTARSVKSTISRIKKGARNGATTTAPETPPETTTAPGTTPETTTAPETTEPVIPSGMDLSSFRDNYARNDAQIIAMFL